MLIAYGSSGEYVQALQTQLGEMGFAVEVTGVYGTDTQAAVLDVQEQLGIEQDGIVDDDFLRAIGLDIEEDNDREEDGGESDGSEYSIDDGQISEHFSLHEFIRSETAAKRGIDNTPTEEHFGNMQRVCALLEVVREHLGAVAVSSGYRGPALNKAIGGSKTSAHMDGRAVDFKVPGVSVEDTAAWIAENLEGQFDQLILEWGRWVHLAVPKEGVDPRGMVLTAHGKTKYTPGLHPELYQ